MYYKLVVLFLQYDSDKYPNSLFYLQKYLSRISQNDVQIIVIDNKQKVNYKERIEDYYYGEPITISGDNTIWEFSGWDKGLEYLKENNIDYDAILFVNDSFLAPSGYDSPITIINDENIFDCIKNNNIIGNICNVGNGLKIDKYNVKKYIRTHCFMLSKDSVEKIKTLVTLDINFINRCINNISTKFYFLGKAPICIDTMKNIVVNLTQNWHSKFNIHDNWGLFRMKSLVMLNELTLYTRISSIIGDNKVQMNIKELINNIPNDKKIVCVGAATNAHKMMKESDLPKKNVVAFLDNYIKGDINGIPIYTPEEFVNKKINYDFAIFCMFQPETIKNQLDSLGIITKDEY